MRPAAVLALTCGLLTVTLAACGATGGNGTTIDAFNLQRGVVVGGENDAPPGTRALSGRVTKTLGDLEGEVNDTLFGDGGDVKRTGYLNGVLPKAGARERVYQGDRAAWLARDAADTAAVPTAVVGMFPAPFSTRFTPSAACCRRACSASMPSAAPARRRASRWQRRACRADSPRPPTPPLPMHCASTWGRGSSCAQPWREAGYAMPWPSSRIPAQPLRRLDQRRRHADLHRHSVWQLGTATAAGGGRRTRVCPPRHARQPRLDRDRHR